MGDARVYEAFGEEKTLREWVLDERCQVGHSTLQKRIQDYGWGVEEAITTPPKPKRAGGHLDRW